LGAPTLVRNSDKGVVENYSTDKKLAFRPGVYSLNTSSSPAWLPLSTHILCACSSDE